PLLAELGVEVVFSDSGPVPQAEAWARHDTVLKHTTLQRCARRAHPLGWDNSRIDLPMTRCGNPTLALRPPHLEHLERAREDPDPARVPRPPRHGAVDQDDEDPGDPARSLAPREAAEHQPRLGVGGGPRLPVALGEGDRAGDYVIRGIAVRAGARQVPDAGDLAPAVVVARADDEELVLLGELQHARAQGLGEPDRLGRAVHYLEAVHAGRDEGVESA